MIIGLLQWWYTKGWGIFAQRLVEKLKGLVDTFSIGSILMTLFEPFRQIDSVKPEHASLEDRFHLFIGRLVSRLVGFIVRFGILIFGLVAMLFEAVISLILMILWPLVPILPVVGVVLTVVGVTF